MRIAVFSDVHGNKHALEEVMKSINNLKPDTVICLGDLVGYGAHPDEVVEIIQENNVETVMGNYDDAIANRRMACGCDFKNEKEQELALKSIQWTTENTSEKSKEFLCSLPENIKKETGNYKVMFVHGSPRRLNEYLFEDIPAGEVLDMVNESGVDVLVCGHTHLPYHREISNRHIINAGSVGKPKHGDPQSVVALIEIDNDIRVDFLRVSYDYVSAAKAVENAGLPSEFAETIRTGIG